MNVSLTPELEEMVSQKVKSGLYNSASEVVREGLRLIREQDQLREIKLEELRREIQIGIDSLDRGEGRVYSSARELIDEIKAEGRAKLKVANGKAG
ncbi:type II toxin-antitoxin system ParD family antitoxin [Abditibacterium utsteinense]|nr:type II toxin-antitoxin system ParD family antitoxin [Abditibacterium utsteinense]